MREQEMEYLTRNEVANTLRVSTRTLDRIVADGERVGTRGVGLWRGHGVHALGKGGGHRG